MDLLEELNIPRVINASGRMTSLGVNTLSDEVLAAMAEAGGKKMEQAKKAQKTVKQ